MDFRVDKRQFSAALRQILQGKKSDSLDLVDLNVEQSSCAMVITGRSVEIPSQTEEGGSFSLPLSVLAKIKRIAASYDETGLRIRLSEGRFRLQGTSVIHPDIRPRRIVRRIIDIPEDALPREILSLPMIFSLNEIADCGLQPRLLEAQHNLARDIDSAFHSLQGYGFSRGDLAEMAQRKIESNAERMKRGLFPKDDA